MIMFHFSSLFYIALERYISYCVWYDILCVFAFFFFLLLAMMIMELYILHAVCITWKSRVSGSGNRGVGNVEKGGASV